MLLVNVNANFFMYQLANNDVLVLFTSNFQACKVSIPQ